MESRTSFYPSNQGATHQLLSSFKNQTGRNHPLATALRELRKVSGLSQEALSFDIEKSREWISYVENGRSHAIDNLNLDCIVSWCSVCKKQELDRKLGNKSQELISSIAEYYQSRLSQLSLSTN